MTGATKKCPPAGKTERTHNQNKARPHINGVKCHTVGKLILLRWLINALWRGGKWIVGQKEETGISGREERVWKTRYKGMSPYLKQCCSREFSGQALQRNARMWGLATLLRAELWGLAKVFHCPSSSVLSQCFRIESDTTLHILSKGRRGKHLRQEDHTRARRMLQCCL